MFNAGGFTKLDMDRDEASPLVRSTKEDDSNANGTAAMGTGAGEVGIDKDGGRNTTGKTKQRAPTKEHGADESEVEQETGQKEEASAGASERSAAEVLIQSQNKVLEQQTSKLEKLEDNMERLSREVEKNREELLNVVGKASWLAICGDKTARLMVASLMVWIGGA